MEEACSGSGSGGRMELTAEAMDRGEGAGEDRGGPWSVIWVDEEVMAEAWVEEEGVEEALGEWGREKKSRRRETVVFETALVDAEPLHEGMVPKPARLMSERPAVVSGPKSSLPGDAVMESYRSDAGL